MKAVAALVLASFVALFASADAQARKSHHARERASAASQDAAFDYYLLSLSWSPSFCATHPQERDQCAGQGYGFVLHGLWPEYEGGMGPQHCASDARPDAATVQEMLAVSPSRSLIAHEWQTHGACSGLGPQDYFAAARRAYASVRVPREIAQASAPPALSAREVARAFVAANPGLREDMLAVQCDGMRLAEVRVCLDKDDLSPRRCGAKVAGNCHQGALQIPLAKGRR